MRHAALVALALAVVSLGAPMTATGERAASAKITGTVFAIESGSAQDFLVRISASSLRPVSKWLPLGGRAYAWSLSPDARRLAIGVDRAYGVRIIDLRRMKRIGRIQTWTRAIASLAWLTPRRIVGWEPAGLFLLDPVARKRLPSPDSAGNVLIARRVGEQLVLLAAPPMEIGAARVAVVEADGVVRSVRLDRIRAGEIEIPHGESYRPALVVDPAGRVYVVGAGADEPVAEVDLSGLGVTYHEPKRERSLLARFRDWLEPAAEAKVPLAGSWRSGAFLGDGKLAVWGYDSVPTGPDEVETTPAGLPVIDTKDWTRRIIDTDAWHAAFAGGTLIATYRGGGLSGFTPSGDLKYRLFDRDALGVVATFGERAFVAFDRKPVHVLEAATGDVLGTRRTVPRLLHPQFSGW